ncbi:MAG: murein biosynthesis integral membrane protein MurJ [Acidobacteria bacterium]|nr:murein biosynthesis integral membrane protein MurJ [Acidobacteriota bacterium]
MDNSPSVGIVRSAGLMSAAVMLSRVAGLVRETIIAQTFGASAATDAFNLAYRLPNLTRDLFAEGALSSAFVPTFTERMATKGKEDAARLVNLVGTAVILFVGILCVMGVLLAPWLVGLFGSGFRQVPGKFEMAVHLTRVMFPFLLLVALAAQTMGVLNSCGQFGVPALASFFFNVGSVASGLLIAFVIGPRIGMEPIEGMAWGVVIGGAVQFLWQVPSLYKQGFRFRLEWDWRDPGLRHIVAMMGPAILGGAAVQINVLVNSHFASFIQDPVRGANGPVTWLGCAFRFMQLPLGLFGVAVAAATLPSITRSLASGNHDEFRRTLSKSLGVVFLMTLPSSIGLVVLAREMIAATYQGGAFTSYDTQQTALALVCYTVGLAGYAASKVLNPAFYALKDSRTPMVVSLTSIAVNFAAASLLLNYTRLGHAGLALTTSTVALTSFLIQFWILRNRIGGVYGWELASTVARVALAALGMGAVVSAVSIGMEAWLGSGKMAAVASLAACVPVGALVFFGVCRLLRVEEVELAASGIPGPFRRVLGLSHARIP